MSKRIRYIKDPTGAYITSNFVKNVDGSEYRAGFVVAESGAVVGFIKSVEDDTTNITFQATSPHKVKIKLKRALIKLGCQFDSETRKEKIYKTP